MALKKCRAKHIRWHTTHNPMMSSCGQRNVRVCTEEETKMNYFPCAYICSHDARVKAQEMRVMKGLVQ